jgi:hypothetical protein
MNNLTNEQIARVFAMYMPVQVCIADEQFKQPINLIGIEESRVLKVRDEGIKLSFVVNIEHSKLLLTPLSAISDEDAVEVAKMCQTYHDLTDESVRLKAAAFGRRLTKATIEYRTYQYLIQKGYAVPLFIEVGHPDNGKSAIELGIAIDKTKS